MNNLSTLKSPPEWDAAASWWENLFNASEDPQIVCRRDGIAEHINAKAARLFKLNASLDEGVFSVFEILSRAGGPQARPDAASRRHERRHGCIPSSRCGTARAIR